VRDVVQEHLRRLPASERQALTLVLLNGLTQREAAAQLRVPPGTVATWIAKGVRALRARLGDQT
jgi:RNA polymerase sigma-70 factor (ECF subfamily)